LYSRGWVDPEHRYLLHLFRKKLSQIWRGTEIWRYWSPGVSSMAVSFQKSSSLHWALYISSPLFCVSECFRLCQQICFVAKFSPVNLSILTPLGRIHPSFLHIRTTISWQPHYFWALSIVLSFISETGFYLRVQVESNQMRPADRATFCLRTPATTIIGFIELTQHNPSMRVNMSICCVGFVNLVRRQRLSLSIGSTWMKTETECSPKWKTKRWIMSGIVIVILIYHRHKPVDLMIRLLFPRTLAPH
jgi:hypothetical protein